MKLFFLKVLWVTPGVINVICVLKFSYSGLKKCKVYRVYTLAAKKPSIENK